MDHGHLGLDRIIIQEGQEATAIRINDREDRETTIIMAASVTREARHAIVVVGIVLRLLRIHRQRLCLRCPPCPTLNHRHRHTAKNVHHHRQVAQAQMAQDERHGNDADIILHHPQATIPENTLQKNIPPQTLKLWSS